MIKAIIVDDEKNNIINLHRLLEKYCPAVEVTATATSVDEAALLIAENKPDLVFLDIRMPGKDGFDLLLHFPEPEFDVVFVTAFDQYGIQAVKSSALDYLLKPIDFRELQQAVERHNNKRRTAELKNLQHTLRHSGLPSIHRIALPGLKETRFVLMNEIICCESDNSYTSFFLVSGEKILVSAGIYEYEELLSPYGFIRPHQSYLVNKNFVKSMINDNGVFLQMTDGRQVPVSRQKKDSVKTALL